MNDPDVPAALRRRGGPPLALRARVLTAVAMHDPFPWTLFAAAAGIGLLLNSFILPGDALMPRPDPTEPIKPMARILAERAALLSLIEEP